jgi:hypothetical protein
MKKFGLKLIRSSIRFLKGRRRGSPLVEEGILIGLSLFGFLLIFSIVTGVLDWLLMNADELLRELGSLFT